MKKRIMAILFTALLAVSFTACGNGDNSGSSSSAPASSVTTESKAESSEESKAEESGSTELGEKTKAALGIMQGDEYTMSLSITVETADGSTSENGSGSSMLSLLGSGGIGIDTVKTKDGRSRMAMTFGTITFDTLTLPEGSYVLDSANKIAYFTKADGSSDSPVSGLMDTESISGMMQPDGLNFKESGKEEFNGKNCDFELYTVKPPVDQLEAPAEDGSSVDSSSLEYDVKFYFDGEKLEGMYIKNNANSFTAVVNELSSTVDESKLKVPDGYEVKDDDGTGAMSIFAGLMGGLSDSEKSAPAAE